MHGLWICRGFGNFCELAVQEYILFYKLHLSGLNKIPRPDLVKIEPAGKLIRIECFFIRSRFAKLIDDCFHFSPEYIENFQRYIACNRQREPDRRRRIERIRIILFKGERRRQILRRGNGCYRTNLHFERIQSVGAIVLKNKISGSLLLLHCWMSRDREDHAGIRRNYRCRWRNSEHRICRLNTCNDQIKIACVTDYRAIRYSDTEMN